MKLSYVYILKCADQSYYIGVTSDLEQRVEQHQSGYYEDSYTHRRRPVELVFYATFTDIRIAIQTEKQFKKWSRAKKEALIEGRFGDLVNLAKKKFRHPE
ncbi:MAG: GIY-YIG nuclease family protein [Flavobacteriaceae bacterium]|nr:GIY-YIG nuclease family protein [Flavobacteriaceae bacterium]